MQTKEVLVRITGDLLAKERDLELFTILIVLYSSMHIITCVYPLGEKGLHPLESFSFSLSATITQSYFKESIHQLFTVCG